MIIVREKTPLWMVIARGGALLGLLLIAWSIWEALKIPVTLTNILWMIVVVSLVFIVGLFAFAKLWPGGKEKKPQEPTTAPAAHAAPAHAPLAAPAAHGPHGHGGGDHHGLPPAKAFVYFMVGVAILVATVLGGTALVNRENNRGWYDRQGRGRPSAEESIAFASATAPLPAAPASCDVPPPGARTIQAPVDGCSEVISVSSNSWACVDPGPSSGRVRIKSWYGSEQPSEWDAGPGRGNKQCLGAAPNPDGSPAVEPVEVHVWTVRAR